MEQVLRAAAVYAIIWFAFRVAGKRTFGEMTTFDFVLVLIISESAQEALLGEDFSLTAATIVVLTLIMIDIGLSRLKQSLPKAEPILDGLPVMLIENGQLNREAMDQERVDESDILDEARKHRGIGRLDQIQYAVLERNGGISIIPYRPQNS